MLTYRQSLPTTVSSGLFALTVLSFVSVKLMFYVLGVDLLASLERLVCYVLFGGLVDDLQLRYEQWLEESTDEQEDPQDKTQ